MSKYSGVSSRPASVLLSSRNQIDKLDAGLLGVSGALEVISLFEERRKPVTKLALNHNTLGDEGCRALFEYLGGERGRRHAGALEEVSLCANKVGDGGLESLCGFLESGAGCGLREVTLQNNRLTGQEHVIRRFKAALKVSKIEKLLLGNNLELGDEFLSRFLPDLDAPTLKHLDISIIGLTPASVPVIISFLTSPRARRLETFKCNANHLTFRGIRAIVNAVVAQNFHLRALELYGNCTERRVDPGMVTDSSDDEDMDTPQNQKVMETKLKNALLRNDMLSHAVERMAKALCSWARALLLVPQKYRDMESPRSRALVLHPQASSISRSPSPIAPPPARFPFTSLPIELQLHVFTFLAPLLSSSQLVRIYNFALDPNTLPPLLPKLQRQCIPDPSSFPFNLGQRKTCGGGFCMGAANSVECHRMKEARRRLEEVGCDRFELDESGENWKALAMF